MTLSIWNFTLGHPVLSFKGIYEEKNAFTAVTPTEEHTHKNEPATLYCTIKGAGKQLKVKWTNDQVIYCY